MLTLLGKIRDSLHSSRTRCSGAFCASPNGDRASLESLRMRQFTLTELLCVCGSGAVFKGMLRGVLPIAVKMIELPEAAVAAEGGGAWAQPGAHAAAQLAPPQQEADAVQGLQRLLLQSAMEVTALQAASHPNIIKVTRALFVSWRSVDCPPCIAVCTELVEGGSLADALRAHTFPRWAWPIRAVAGSAGGSAGANAASCRPMVDMRGLYLTVLEVASALQHLHDLRLVHRDVHPGNVLLQPSRDDPRGWTCKLADFGFVCALERQDLDHGGAPYTVVDEPYGTRVDASVDVYALGILMWELLAGRGRRPYAHVDPPMIAAAVWRGMRPTFPSDVVPLSYRLLAQACWAHDPRQRPCAAEVAAACRQQLERMAAAECVELPMVRRLW
ncbi:hypothetical protein GPECTOR_9g644 [Gonium pectorale]|uniref:Protein kinase domain-containing protein n=1 Tax=Gonium pectorale TaxID=33097 RepID=A0A150GRX3_GONPE|nr:hypothetical protein GPECTOR_9g644 [Gonium pectorale]|eukprot:KXZ52599.1 hypothetical protein GPECTOR_9g644 [Gonium pectorale]